MWPRNSGAVERNLLYITLNPPTLIASDLLFSYIELKSDLARLQIPAPIQDLSCLDLRYLKGSVSLDVVSHDCCMH